MSLVEQRWQQRVDTVSRFATRAVATQWYHGRVKIPFQIWHQKVVVYKQLVWRKQAAARAMLRRLRASKAGAFQIWYHHVVALHSTGKRANKHPNTTIQGRNWRGDNDGSAQTDPAACPRQ